MFNILYNINIEEWCKQFITSDFPNFKVLYPNEATLEIGTKAMLYNFDDKHYYELNWSVSGNYDIYNIYRINDIYKYINNGYKSYIDFKKDCLLNHTHYYQIKLYRTFYTKNVNILDNKKYDFYKIPTSEIPRKWLQSSTYYERGQIESDIVYLTNLYTNVNSSEYKNFTTRYNHTHNILNTDEHNGYETLLSIKRDLEINSILFDL